MRVKYLLVTAVALVGSSLLYGDQVYLSVQDNKSTNPTSVQTQSQNTNQGKPPVSGGGTSHGGGSGPRHRAAMIAKDAAKAIDEIMSVPDKAIPVELLARAEAIAIFPSGGKDAYIVGGVSRQGVISKRIEDGWGPPVFFHLSDAVLGSQIGTQKTDYVLLIMSEDSLSGLVKDKFEIGREQNVAAAGPVGRMASGSTDPRIVSRILSYSRSSGLFSGSVLKSAVIRPDNDLNETIYRLKASELLRFSSSGRDKLPAELRVLQKTLTRYSHR